MHPTSCQIFRDVPLKIEAIHGALEGDIICESRSIQINLCFKNFKHQSFKFFSRVTGYMKLSFAIVVSRNITKSTWVIFTNGSQYTDYVIHRLINKAPQLLIWDHLRPDSAWGVVLLGWGCHSGDETVIGTSCLHGGISCTCVRISLSLGGAQHNAVCERTN